MSVNVLYKDESEQLNQFFTLRKNYHNLTSNYRLNDTDQMDGYIVQIAGRPKKKDASDLYH